METGDPLGQTNVSTTHPLAHAFVNLHQTHHCSGSDRSNN